MCLIVNFKIMKKASKGWKKWIVRIGILGSIASVSGLSFRVLIQSKNDASSKMNGKSEPPVQKAFSPGTSIINIENNDSLDISNVKNSTSFKKDSTAQNGVVNISNNKNSKIKNISNEGHN